MAPKVTLYANGLVPNPVKVAILLEELEIEYAIVQKDRGDGPNGVKAADFLKINPNGRLPALIDHTNNDHIVWESGAILLYVAERFDPTHKLLGKTLEERSQVWEWLFFQGNSTSLYVKVSGLGPTAGQVAWFLRSHPVKDLDSSVIERYRNETYRIYGVLEKRLEKEGEWIALKRFTVVDIANYPYELTMVITSGLNAVEYIELSFDGFPKLAAYRERMKALPSVQKAWAKLA
ncbi:glutathione S-transferase [Ramaria rubella]|nr:glutathione S-transferase [Ramaria rubella]